ncbi:protein YIPF1-like [Ptychodera flava]|uniref:protein YIPF1-like n=1 Tax=Ptychodera flava TaxID=63121 RepID=UPI00396A0530
MANPNDAVVDIDKDKDEVSADDLKFQDFSDSNIEADRDGGQTHNFDNYPSGDEEEDEGDKTELLTGQKKPPSFWTFEYYQTFFDVETYQVLRRLLGSFVPKPSKNFRDEVRANPDLYGPFWVCITLVFTTAITGDVANYFATAGHPDLEWHPDFKKVSIAATAIFCYWWFIGSSLWGVLTWRKSQAGYSYLEIICIYGYSLFIYIPVSFLYVIPIHWVQWVLLILALLLSGGVLLLTFWPAVRDDDKKIAIAIMVGIFLLHAVLAVGFKFYFFNAPEIIDTGTDTPPTMAHQPTLPLHPQTIKQQLQQVLHTQQLIQPMPSQHQMTDLQPGATDGV